MFKHFGVVEDRFAVVVIKVPLTTMIRFLFGVDICMCKNIGFFL